MVVNLNIRIYNVESLKSQYLSHCIFLKNDEMSKVSSWVEANKLSLDIDKTNVMLFTPKGFF